MDDGIGVARLDPVDLPWTWSTVFRVLRDGRETISSSPDGLFVGFEPPELDLGIEFPRSAAEEERLAARVGGDGRARRHRAARPTTSR